MSLETSVRDFARRKPGSPVPLGEGLSTKPKRVKAKVRNARARSRKKIVDLIERASKVEVLGQGASLISSLAELALQQHEAIARLEARLLDVEAKL